MIKYEKVTGSIFDLKEEFENGELYFPVIKTNINGHPEEAFTVIDSEKMLILAASGESCIYRQVKTKKTYKGVELPEWAEWVAMDAGGAVYVYESKPVLHRVRFEWTDKSGEGKVECVSEDIDLWDDFKDWKDSLIKL